MKKAVPYPAAVLHDYGPQKTYSGANLLQIAMPMGGIGAGCICLTGEGGLRDFSIHHRPENSALPDKHLPTDAGFAILHIQGEKLTRLVEGPFPVEKIYNQGLKAQGYNGGGYEGLPRFRHCSFRGEYPFGFVSLTDPNMPLAVNITGFSPLIPLDVKNSGIPCAILEYTLTNTSPKTVHYQFSYHLSHLAIGADPRGLSSRNSAIPEKGIYFWNREPEDAAAFGSASLTVIGSTPKIKAVWLRGGWFDSVSSLWRELTEGRFETIDRSADAPVGGRNGGSVLLEASLPPQASVTYPILITWHFPNVPYASGRIDEKKECGDPAKNVPTAKRCWRPYYAAQWQDAGEVAAYVHEQYPSLRQRTQAFHDALFNSTLPAYVLEAISANLAILKSPTLLLQANGDLWGWEGCFSDHGCCAGTCTHVWNYSQAIPHLYPSLERTLREQELSSAMDERGHINFRMPLPAGATTHDYHPAADGQLGGVMKVFREWQISGDHEWLRRMYPLVKRSLDFCIETWDPRHVGVLEEPHHNTYDIEFWGPDGMCTSFYLGALNAMVAVARACGHPDDAAVYQELAHKGMRYLDEHLFNGEYHEQHVTYEGLKDKSFSHQMANIAEEGSVEQKLLKREGPKYQYGSGCISDGVMGDWLAEMCGFHSSQNQQNVKRNLKAIFEYNFKESLWDHANPQRPGFAWGDEPGLLLCTWPKGGKPTLPFIYSDEVWTGIEYQVASHLILQGFLEEGLTIVKALRSRYDGHVRNPWNEYECGSYYARAMASYALLQALSGFQYSRVTGTLTLSPKLDPHHLQVFFSTACGWGTIALQEHSVEIKLCEGELRLEALRLTQDGETTLYPLHATCKTGEITKLDISKTRRMGKE